MDKKTRFKAIFFDAGGTLFAPHPSVGEIYAEVARRYGCSVPHDGIERRFHQEWEKRDNHAKKTSDYQERQWWYELVYDIFLPFGGVTHFEAFFDELYDIFARPEYWKLFPEILDVISELKESGFVLGIVSNWDSRLLSLCQKLGLKEHFDFILASGLVGISKPHPGIFQEALRCSGALPHEVLHVGDSLEDDVHGPRGLGIHAVLVDRSGRREFDIPKIGSLSELFSIVF